MINYTNGMESARGFIMGALFEQAEKCRAEYQTALAFAELWMSFNTWGSLVTGEDTDREMIVQLGNEQRLSKAFRDHFENDETFRNAVLAFARFWPIFSNSDIGQLGLWPQMQTLYSAGREASNAHLMTFPNKKAAKGGVRRGPNDKDFKRNAPSWLDTLGALYMVRNNLMHGTKGFDGDDHEIIAGAYAMLHEFIRRNGLYTWEGEGLQKA
jgi:hypothetical protein